MLFYLFSQVISSPIMDAKVAIFIGFPLLI